MNSLEHILRVARGDKTRGVASPDFLQAAGFKLPRGDDGGMSPLITAANIPAGAAKTRAIPRILTAYCGPNKKDFLCTEISLRMAGALPSVGGNRKHVRLVEQTKLAQMCGLASRATYTRRLTRFRRPDRTDQPSPTDVASLIKRDRQFAAPNRYTSLLPATFDSKRLEIGAERPAIEQLLADEHTKALFDREMNWHGFTPIPKWVWHPSLGVSDYARLLMSYLIMCGLTRRGEDGKIIRERKISRREMKLRTGLSKKTIASCLRELEMLGLIRVVQSELEITEHGPRRGPSRIFWIPKRRIDQAAIAAERRRFLLARAKARARMWLLPREQRQHALRALWVTSRIFRQQLALQEGKAQRITAIWKSLRSGLSEVGVSDRLLSELFPAIFVTDE